MKLRSGRTFWPSRAPRERTFAALRRDVTCEVAIVGGGIVGALAADALATPDRSVVWVDKDRIGRGSTSASTALLLYELDVHLVDLARKIGLARAARVYTLSLRSIGAIGRLARELGVARGFRPMKSLYAAFERRDAAALKREFALRRAHGFRVHWLDAEEIRARFGIVARAAIVSDVAAEVDPYRLTRALLARARRRGARVFERTEVTAVRPDGGSTLLDTPHATIRARDVIMATGYESQSYLARPVVRLKSSFVVVSRPVPELAKHWLHEHLFWEAARPYLYVRTTADGRVIVGGEDEEVVDDAARDALIPRKARRLWKRFRALVPDLAVTPDYAWAGTFGETKDGMGYVGTPSGWKRVHFALGFGGNGITFGIIAADLLARIVRGRRPRDAALFSFDRVPGKPGRTPRTTRGSSAHRTASKPLRNRRRARSGSAAR